ncbi:hypothetical protein KI387_003039, partial [Taxus chinensis]
ILIEPFEKEKSVDVVMKKLAQTVGDINGGGNPPNSNLNEALNVANSKTTKLSLFVENSQSPTDRQSSHHGSSKHGDVSPSLTTEKADPTVRVVVNFEALM